MSAFAASRQTLVAMLLSGARNPPPPILLFGEKGRGQESLLCTLNHFTHTTVSNIRKHNNFHYRCSRD